MSEILSGDEREWRKAEGLICRDDDVSVAIDAADELFRISRHAGQQMFSVNEHGDNKQYGVTEESYSFMNLSEIGGGGAVFPPEDLSIQIAFERQRITKDTAEVIYTIRIVRKKEGQELKTWHMILSECGLTSHALMFDKNDNKDQLGAYREMNSDELITLFNVLVDFQKNVMVLREAEQKELEAVILDR